MHPEILSNKPTAIETNRFIFFIFRPFSSSSPSAVFLLSLSPTEEEEEVMEDTEDMEATEEGIEDMARDLLSLLQ